MDHLLRCGILVILSVIGELQHTTPYGALPSEVHDRVLDVIKLTPLEYKYVTARSSLLFYAHLIN